MILFLFEAYYRFFCSKNLQEKKKCDDFEARFCCLKSSLATSTTIKPATTTPFNDKSDSAELKDINITDLRNLNNEKI